jgi:hypothetical protein
MKTRAIGPKTNVERAGNRRPILAKEFTVKKFLLPIGAGVVVFGVVTAFAASLNVTTKSLGAGNAVVSSCQTNALVTYSSTGSKVNSATVTVSGLTGTPCDGLAYQVTLTGNGSLATTPVTEGGNITGSAGTADFSGDSVNPHDVTGVAVVITG